MRVASGSKAVLAHAERREDALLHHLAQPLAGDRLRPPGRPSRCCCRTPNRRPDRTAAASSSDAFEAVMTLGWPVLLRQPVVVLVEEVVAEAGRVQQQHAGGDVALGCAQLGLAVRRRSPRGPAARRSRARISWPGASRSSLPSSTSCSAAVPVIALVVEKIANTVSVVMSASWPRTALAGRTFVDVAAAGRSPSRPRPARARLPDDGPVQDRVGGVFQSAAHRLAPFTRRSFRLPSDSGWRGQSPICREG